MEFRIWKLLITITLLPESILERRCLARKVDKLAIERCHTQDSTRGNLFIQRIKAYREIKKFQPGLKESKEWVMQAFADGGKGNIL